LKLDNRDHQFTYFSRQAVFTDPVSVETPMGWTIAIAFTAVRGFQDPLERPDGGTWFASRQPRYQRQAEQSTAAIILK
jgi:hypothetical protein